VESSGGDGSWKVLGPIDVLPEQEHDYSQVDRKTIRDICFQYLCMLSLCLTNKVV
jgi:hypothetical protein